MSRVFPLAAAAILAASTHALAESHGGEAGSAAQALPMTYEIFEAAVPHADLSECPAAMAAEGHFCRLGIGEELTVFVFSEEGDQPLVAARSWPADVVLPHLE